MKISLVTPLYNEEEIIDILIDRSITTLQSITDDFEIICVDDGSKDKTLSNLISHHKKDSRVKVLELSRNFGHQAAYSAGLAVASGEFVVMLDGDLQDPPEIIPQMFDKLNNEDFDIVYGKRTGRNENFSKKLSIKLFHYIFNRLSKLRVPTNVGNFSIMNRKALNAFLQLGEKNRYLPGMRYYIGFKQTFVEYERPDREIGRSKMSFIHLTKLAFDAIFSFSKLPIKLSLLLGTIGIITSIIGAGVVIVKKIIGDAITGWTSEMLGLFFFGSVQLFFLGILGEYVFRIFIETKDRPVYIIRNFHDQDN